VGPDLCHMGIGGVGPDLCHPLARRLADWPIDKKVQCFAGHPADGYCHLEAAFCGHFAALRGWCWGRRERDMAATRSANALN
jgi:hypothetical protein